MGPPDSVCLGHHQLDSAHHVDQSVRGPRVPSNRVVISSDRYINSSAHLMTIESIEQAAISEPGVPPGYTRLGRVSRRWVPRRGKANNLTVVGHCLI